MKDVEITEQIKYIGVDDKTIDLFEGQYVVPNGISYNSYLIKDKKNVVMDTVDKRAGNEWFKNLENELKRGKSRLFSSISFRTRPWGKYRTFSK